MPDRSGIAVGIDIGGTKLAAGLIGADGTVIEHRRRDTPAGDPDGIVATAADLARELTGAHGLERVPVGVGAAGIVDREGVMRYAPNIRWADFPLRDALQDEVDGSVTVHNDGNVAAWGEFCCGAGREAGDTMVMFTIGTGVGGGIVLSGRLVRGTHGLGAELGHMIVAEGGPRCPCGNQGCLEALASGTAMGRLADEWRREGRLPADWALRDVAEPTGKDVTIAAHAGDAGARSVLEETGFWLGVGVATIANALDPEIVVVGGGAMQAGELLLEPARRSFGERLMGRPHRPLPEVVRAALGDDGGIVGAGLLALEEAA